MITDTKNDGGKGLQHIQRERGTTASALLTNGTFVGTGATTKGTDGRQASAPASLGHARGKLNIGPRVAERREQGKVHSEPRIGAELTMQKAL